MLIAEKTNRYLSITKALSNCSIDNSKNRVIEEQGYGATITADDGYTLDGGTITITMGGVDMSTYYSNGKIAIPNVTGDIVITATAVPSAPAYTNLADPSSEDWMNGYKISGTGAITEASGKTLCNKIDCNTNDVIRVKGVTFKDNNDRYLFGNASGSGAHWAHISVLPNVSLSYTMEGDVYAFTILQKTFSGQGNIRFSFDTPTDASTIIITRNEEIS